MQGLMDMSAVATNPERHRQDALLLVQDEFTSDPFEELSDENASFEETHEPKRFIPYANQDRPYTEPENPSAIGEFTWFSEFIESLIFYQPELEETPEVEQLQDLDQSWETTSTHTVSDDDEPQGFMFLHLAEELSFWLATDEEIPVSNLIETARHRG